MNDKTIFENKYIFGDKIELYFDFINQGRIFKRSKKIIFILGDPIIDDKINFSLIINKIEINDFNNSFIKNIDGEFLIIIVENNNSVEIINDRFSSIPIFYSTENNKLRIKNSIIINF